MLSRSLYIFRVIFCATNSATSCQRKLKYLRAWGFFDKLTKVTINSVEPEPKKLGRRGFLKASLVGLGALAISEEIWALTHEQVPMSRRALNAAKVCEGLISAERKGNIEEITQARKTLLVWVFAESSSLFAKEADLGTAGKMMEHYLYGDGKDFDLSPVFEKFTNDPVFWMGFFSIGLYTYNDSLGDKRADLTTTEGFSSVFPDYAEKIKNKFTFVSGVAAKKAGSDWNWAIGHSLYTLEADLIASKPEKSEGEVPKINLTINYPSMSMEDVYDWDLKYTSAYLPDKANLFASTLAQPLFGWFIESKNVAGQLAEKLKLPDNQRQLIIDTIENTRLDLASVGRGVPKIVEKTEKWATAGQDVKLIVEEDMNLLQDIGAKDYKIVGKASYKGNLSVQTDTMFSLPL